MLPQDRSASQTQEERTLWAGMLREGFLEGEEETLKKIEFKLAILGYSRDQRNA